MNNSVAIFRYYVVSVMCMFEICLLDCAQLVDMSTVLN